MQCVSFVTQGNTVKIQIDQPLTTGGCPSLVVLSNADYSAINLATTGATEPITPAQVQTVFSWGFGVVLLFWSLGYAIGAAKMAISKT